MFVLSYADFLVRSRKCGRACVNDLQTLTRILLETLKGLRVRKDPLTADSLLAALANRKDLLPFVGNAGEGCSMSTSLFRHDNLPDTKRNVPYMSDLHLNKICSKFTEILDLCSLLLEGGDHPDLIDIKEKITKCCSIDDLIICSETTARVIETIIDNTNFDIDTNKQFLLELSKELVKIHNQLESLCADHRECNAIENNFTNTLLNHTKDIKNIFTTKKELGEIRSFILSKVSVISDAIQEKKRADESKLQAAERKINELQSNLQTYTDEIIQMKERASALEKDALIDQTMGIANRRAYELQIRESLRRCCRSQESFGLLLIDVDEFKSINDTFGHQAGDRCLKEIASSIKFCLRKSDFLARYGGEEIIVILPGVVIEDAKKVAEKIRKSIETTVFWHNCVSFSVTISIGLTAVTEEDDPASLFARVDGAMYDAKNSGRNRIRAA